MYYLIAELICLKEAFHPASEGQLIYHQLLDISNHIRQFGPLRNTWAFGGERCLCTIKNCCCSKGGMNADVTTIKRYCKLENSRTADSYDFNLQNIGNYKDLRGQKRDLQKSMNCKSSTKVKTKEGKDYLEYNFNNFHMWNKQNDKKWKDFTLYEQNNLLLSYISEIYKQFNDLEDAYEKSGVFRLYLSYKLLSTGPEWLFKGTFAEYIFFMDDYRTNNLIMHDDNGRELTGK